MMYFSSLVQSVRAFRFLSGCGRISSRNNRFSPYQELVAFSQHKKPYTDSAKSIHVEQDVDIKEISILRLDRKPVNDPGKDLLFELDKALENLENNPSCRGVILTSARPNIFSAGIDVTEIYNRSDDQIKAVYVNLQNMWLRLYGSRLVTMAAINGHCPGAGCLMALSCDFRVMASGRYKIGLNFTFMGVAPPFWMMDTMSNTIGHRETEKALQLGKLHNSNEALEKGLVDVLAEDTEVVDVAKKHMVNWLKIPDHARQISKQMMRETTLDKLRARKDEDTEYNTKLLQKESVQKALGIYKERMEKKYKNDSNIG